MRTTVDLPPHVRERALEIARSRGQSLSSVVAELTIRGLTQIDAPMEITVDPKSGFPVVSYGHEVTSEDVADILDDE